MSCCFRLLQSFVLTLLVLAIGGVATAAVVDYWWVIDVKLVQSKTGLWRKCIESIIQKSECEKRDDLFQFSSNKNYDMVLVGLCAAVSCFITSITLTIATLCQKYPSKCLVLVETIVTFLGVGACSFSVAWALTKISSNYLGWAFYSIYGGTGAGVLAFLFSLILMCIRAPNPYHSTRRDDEMMMLS